MMMPLPLPLAMRMMLMMMPPLLLLPNLPVLLAAEDGNPAQFGKFQDGGYDRHPMLFFSARDVAGLRASAAASSHAHIVSRLHEAALTMMEQSSNHLPPWDPLEFGAIWNEIYGNNLGAMAFYSFLYPNDTGARDFTIEYMDRMAAQPNWLVTLYPKDEVPIGHSLAGFATAYDLMYEHLDSTRRKQYLVALVNSTEYMYNMSFIRGWGFQYLQNHQPTNAVALLMGGLVIMIDGYHREAAVWVKQAMSIMEKSMFITNEVTDGSLNEGIAYGSYLSRSLLKHIFFAKRHFNISHEDNIWVKKHFDFFYRSLQPGFQRTVGISDSNYNWYYGPEAHLAFLDTYVLRDGSGNWLASQINTFRPKNGTGASFRAHRWCTLHLEYIWYDATLPPTPPPDYGTPALHHFESWGVVTYGSPQPAQVNATFVGFKSGKIGGAAVNDIVREKRYPEWVNGWRNFNPGHEHPDQNTFIFTPNGVPFIVEGLYGPKFTWHSNVPMFRTNPLPARELCKPPWVGQMVEVCDWNWVTCDKSPVCSFNGRVLAAAEQNGTVFIRGNSEDTYEAGLGLSSLVRDVVLLNPQLALVVDHIHLDQKSTVTGVASFFHNLDWSFEQEKKGILHGAKIPRPDGNYSLYWTDDKNLSPRALLVDEPYPPGFQIKGTHFVQIEFDVRKPLTRLAYVFLGPAMALDGLVMVAKEESVDVVVQVNGQTYSVLLNSQRLVESANASYCEVTHSSGDVKKTFRATGSATAGNASSPGYKGDHVQRLAERLQLLDVVFDKVAEDVDECVNSTQGCEQLCVNTIGSFHCACRPGFHLDANSTACLVSPTTRATTTGVTSTAVTAKQTTAKGSGARTRRLPDPALLALLAAVAAAATTAWSL
ncbi:dermatan-sulfate epimerase-like [Lampetra fluviatilis]